MGSNFFIAYTYWSAFSSSGKKAVTPHRSAGEGSKISSNSLITPSVPWLPRNRSINSMPARKR